MIARYAGACLGLLAFSISVFAGVSAGNSLTSTLTRAVSALVICCLIGAVIGAVAQSVVNEHFDRREAEMLASRHAVAASNEEPQVLSTAGAESTEESDQPGTSAA